MCCSGTLNSPGSLSLCGGAHNGHQQQLGRKSVQLLLFKGFKEGEDMKREEVAGRHKEKAGATEKKAGRERKDENGKRVNEAV